MKVTITESQLRYIIQESMSAYRTEGTCVKSVDDLFSYADLDPEFMEQFTEYYAEANGSDTVEITATIENDHSPEEGLDGDYVSEVSEPDRCYEIIDGCPFADDGQKEALKGAVREYLDTLRDVAEYDTYEPDADEPYYDRIAGL